MILMRAAVDWTGVGTTITGVAALIAALTGLRNGRRISANTDRIEDVHTAVNNTAQKQNRRTDQLTAALTAAAVAVPPRDPPEGDEAQTESMPVPKEHDDDDSS